MSMYPLFSDYDRWLRGQYPWMPARLRTIAFFFNFRRSAFEKDWYQ